MIAIARNNVQLKQSDVERKSRAGRARTGSAGRRSTHRQSVADGAGLQLEQLVQQDALIRNQLLGDPDLPDGEISRPTCRPRRRSTRPNATSTTPCCARRSSGIATQVDNIQLGRYVTAGTPVFSVIDDQRPWVDANPKETDITYLQLGQKAWVYVDTFPGHHTFRGTVISVSPGTGAQFAILPPQNASGNWVKVVQRVPVRIAFDRDQQPVQAALRHERDGRNRHAPPPHAGLAVRRRRSPSRTPAK